MESNFTASGGFGPNQVSAILGLGALMMILLVVQSRAIGKKMIALGLSISLLTLCVLTFSRGGIYNVVASLFVVAVLTFRNSRLRVAYFSVILIILLIIGFYIYPELDQFTGGMLKTRFSNVDTTGRSDIAKAQLSIWVNNPILGVGPGMSSNTLENEFGVAIASHTEYARFLSEHGIPGAIALFIILLIGIKAYLRTPFGFPQAWMAALLVWPLMEMTHAAMRIAAIGFIFGLSTAKWKLENGKGLTGR
jgi:O-antigen ligase